MLSASSPCYKVSVLVECPGRNPPCFGSSKFLQCVCMRSSTILSINLEGRGSSEIGLKLLVSLEVSALGSGVTLAISHSFGTSDSTNERLKISIKIAGTAKKSIS